MALFIFHKEASATFQQTTRLFNPLCRRVFVAFLALGLLSLATAGGIFADTTVIRSTKVAYTFEGQPDTNYGSDIVAKVGYTEHNKYDTWVQFDLSSIPGEAQINSAYLRLKVKQNNGSGINVKARMASATWSETGITWNTPLGVFTSPSDTQYVSGTGWQQWIVTEMVQRWLNGTAVETGFGLWPSSFSEGSNHWFYSDDDSNSDNHPELLVIYNEPCVAPVAAFFGSPTGGTKPLTVHFYDQSTNYPTSWSWIFGDGTTSSSQNPSHTYNTAGTYTVSLTVTNSCGSDSETKSNYIAVNESCVAPVANFSASPRSGDKPLTVSFFDQSTNSPTTWSWSFGDEETSISQNPSHYYSNAGTYTVSLTVSNSCGSDTETKTNFVTVNEPCLAPQAGFSGSPTSGQKPLTVSFTDQSTNTPTSWSWSFGDGGTSTSQNPSHNYTNDGTYTVSLTVSNSCGSDTETRSDYVSVESDSLDTKAIIVAGGGTEDNLWDAVNYLANYAYLAFRFKGVQKEDIYYLSPLDQDVDINGQMDDVDDVPTLANLEYGIKAFTDVTGGHLIVYMGDHGGDGTFKVSGTETLTAQMLDSWLDYLQMNGGCQVTVIIDACRSGSFIPYLSPPSGEKRIIATSSSSDETAFFADEGAISFSQFFFNQIYTGVTVGECFTKAKSAINFVSIHQNPQLDDNGNGTPNERNDGLIARSTHIGAPYLSGSDIPQIGSITENVTIEPGTPVTIWAQNVIDADGIERVWATITPPEWSPPDPGEPVIELSTLELLYNAINDRYEEIYDQFDQRGVYKATIYAQDPLDSISVPKQMLVTVGANNEWPAVYDMILGEAKNRDLKLLREFRDEVLKKDPVGKGWVDLLYRHSSEIAWILLKNQSLKDQTRDVVKELLPITRSFLEGTEIASALERMAEVAFLLDQFEKEASPSLRDALSEVREDLRDLGYLEDSYEDDDTSMNASVVVVNDDPQSHNFHDAGDQDWVKFYGLESYPYTVKTTDLGANCDTVLYLYDADGVSLLKGPVDDQRYGEDEVLSWSCENDGIYYVMVKQYDSSDFGEDTDYDLVVFTPLGPLTGVITGSVIDSGTGTHIDEAIVTSDIGGAAITMAGYFVMISPVGICRVTASVNGYRPASRSNIVVEDGGETTVDFSLDRMTGDPCPAALALNNDESRLSMLRDFRDKVLNRRLPNLRASELYYKHSLELASLLKKDKESREETGLLLTELIPEIQSVIQGGTMTVTKNQLDNMVTLMRRVASQARPDLKDALDELIWELENSQFLELEGVGINIPVN